MLIITDKCSQFAVSQVLLEAGADRDGTDQSGQAPLHLAAKDGHIAVVKVLLASSAHTMHAAIESCMLYH